MKTIYYNCKSYEDNLIGLGYVTSNGDFFELAGDLCGEIPVIRIIGKAGVYPPSSLKEFAYKEFKKLA